MRVHAALANELELVRRSSSGARIWRALADEDEHLGVFEAFGERVGVLDVVVPDFDLMSVQLPEAGKASSACRSSRRES